MIFELIQAHPRTGIIAIAVLISFFISLINYFVLDKEKMRASRKRQKEIGKELKDNRDNPTKAMELNKELMQHTMETFKHSFKPMIITTIPVLLVFAWMRGVFAETTIASTWFWYYLGAVIASSLIFRKLFKLP